MLRKLSYFILVFLIWIPTSPVAAAQAVVQIEFVRSGADVLPPNRLESIRRLHARLLAEGQIFAWYDYSVRFPRSRNYLYDHVVVTVFTDAQHIAARNALMPEMGRVVRRELAYPNYSMRSPGYETIASPFITVHFLRAERSPPAADGWAESWKPVLDQGFVDTGLWTTWALFDMPGVRRSDDYNFVIVARHRAFADAERDIEIPETLLGDIRRSRSELWRLNSILLPTSP